MATITLITGGGRSGKSAYALQQANETVADKIFIATCPILDDEMQQRVNRHRDERAHQGWTTVEESVHLADAIRQAPRDSTLLVDCLTLWLNNLMFARDTDGQELSEDDVAALTRDVIQAARDRGGNTFLVTNEVGMGIIPENALARRFRDLAGRCNQSAAQDADKVILMVSGIPLPVK